MYQSQARPLVGRTLFAQQKSKQHQPGLYFYHDAADAGTSAPQTLLPLRKQGGKIAVAAIICFLIIALSGCGVSYNSANPNAERSGRNGVLSQISCGTQSLTGAQSKSCSVDLASEARKSTVIALRSSNAALQVPSEVTVSKGAKSATFEAVSSSVTTALKVTITGTLKGLSKTDVITLYPASSASTSTGKLSKISCGTNSLTGPTTQACSVSLTDAATSAVAVSLTSSSSSLKVPSSVTVAQGATTTSFNVTASAVTSSQSVTLTASSGGVSQTDVIQLLGSSGQSTTQHKVQLTWSAPSDSSANIVGYKVYRTTSGSSDYASLSSSIDTQTSYVDTTVQSGSTYEYVVTSVDDSGKESNYSNSTTITVP